jgi:hypothetical protein
MSTKTPPAHKGHQIRHHEQSRKETIHLNQRNHPRDNPTTHHTGRPPSHPADEVKLGIDFWHAVEFSRSGRTPTNRLSAARRGNPSSLGQRAPRVKSHGPDRSHGLDRGISALLRHGPCGESHQQHVPQSTSPGADAAGSCADRCGGPGRLPAPAPPCDHGRDGRRLAAGGDVRQSARHSTGHSTGTRPALDRARVTPSPTAQRGRPPGREGPSPTEPKRPWRRWRAPAPAAWLRRSRN